MPHCSNAQRTPREVGSVSGLFSRKLAFTTLLLWYGARAHARTHTHTRTHTHIECARAQLLTCARLCRPTWFVQTLVFYGMVYALPIVFKKEAHADSHLDIVLAALVEMPSVLLAAWAVGLRWMNRTRLLWMTMAIVCVSLIAAASQPGTQRLCGRLREQSWALPHLRAPPLPGARLTHAYVRACGRSGCTGVQPAHHGGQVLRGQQLQRGVPLHGGGVPHVHQGHRCARAQRTGGSWARGADALCAWQALDGAAPSAGWAASSRPSSASTCCASACRLRSLVRSSHARARTHMRASSDPASPAQYMVLRLAWARCAACCSPLRRWTGRMRSGP